MRKSYLAPALTLTILILASGIAWAATATFTPPPQAGNIFTVINFDRSPGARSTAVAVDWGPFSRSDRVAHIYGSCARSWPSGFVLMLRHSRPESIPFTVTTTGTIVRGPYQGAAPPEISHPCYRFLKFRARN
jgi:hypothetical protein